MRSPPPSCHLTVQAAPWPVFGSLDQVCPQGVPLDVATGREQVLVALHRERLETALVDVPAAPAVAVRVPALRVGQRQPADKPREFAVPARPDDQMPVVGHHAIGQQPCPLALDSLLQNPLKGLVVTVVLEDGHAGVGTIEDVIDQSAVICSFRSSHGSEDNEGRLLVNQRFLTPFLVPPLRRGRGGLTSQPRSFRSQFCRSSRCRNATAASAARCSHSRLLSVRGGVAALGPQTKPLSSWAN